MDTGDLNSLPKSPKVTLCQLGWGFQSPIIPSYSSDIESQILCEKIYISQNKGANPTGKEKGKTQRTKGQKKIEVCCAKPLIITNGSTYT